MHDFHTKTFQSVFIQKLLNQFSYKNFSVSFQIESDGENGGREDDDCFWQNRPGRVAPVGVAGAGSVIRVFTLRGASVGVLNDRDFFQIVFDHFLEEVLEARVEASVPNEVGL